MTEVDQWMIVVDASTPRCVVVVGRLAEGPHAALFADEEDDGDRQASARLHERAAALFVRAAIGPRDLAIIGCGRGPGTFTGTRVAVAFCKGLAEAIQRPVVAVSTLAAVAASVEVDGPVMALLDARRDEVYAAAFHLGDDVASRGPEHCAAIEVALAGSAGHHLVGPGIAPYEARIEASFVRTPMAGPSARGLWRAAVAAHVHDGPRDAASLEAAYLRESYAELGVNVAKRPVFRSPLV